MRCPARFVPAVLFLSMLAASASLLAPEAVEGAIIRVNSMLQGPGVGGVCTLGAAILAANTQAQVDGCPAGEGPGGVGGTLIVLPVGTYTLTVGNPPNEFEFDGPVGLPSVASEITINGAGAATTIIHRDSGASPFRIFHISSGSVTLADVTVSGGSAGAGFSGGGIFLRGGALTIEKSILSDHTASLGGAIANPFCRAITIINSTLSGNLATHSGGAISTNFSPPSSPCFPTVITNSTFSSNRAGGTAGDIGGAIENVGGTLTITNSTVSGNTASGGGGIANISACCTSDGHTIIATLTLTNSTVSGNTAFQGGGIVDHSGTIDLNNVTIANNSADSGGGGVSSFDSFILFRNTIVAGNTDLSGQGPECFISEGPGLGSRGHNLIQDTTGCPIGGDSTGNITGVDPRLGPLQDNGGPTFTHALLAGSPAIDAGDPTAPGSGGTACEATDQRGVTRPQGAACDIGAFEFGAIPPATIIVTESIVVSDALQVVPPAVITVAEAITVSDAPAVVPPAVIVVTESIAVADAPTVLPPALIAVAETIRVSDGPTLLPAALIMVTESITVRDTPAVVPPAVILVAESIAVTDASTIRPPAVITVAETIRVSDGPTLLPAALIIVTESITVSDAPAVVPPAVIVVTESIAVADAPTVLPPAVITVAETIRVSDVPSLLPAALITVAEVITVRDVPGVFPPAVILVAESIAVTDAPAVVPPAVIAVAEVITVSDAPGLLPAALITVAESIRVSDAPTVLPPAVILVAELIAISDTPGWELPATVSVNDVLVAKSSAETTDAVFTVGLSNPSNGVATVKFDTADGTAQAGSHYIAKSGTLIFKPGETTRTISVAIKGDAKEMAGRTFFVHLTKPTNATISRSPGKATIMGDDAADLSLKKTVSPDPAMVGKLLTYTLVVRNDGPGRATGVKVTDDLSSGLSFISANRSAGGCSEGGGTVTCNIPELGKEATTRVTIMVIPTTAGTLTNTARVTGNEGDSNPGNNTAIARITVYGPTVVIRPMVAVTNRDEDTVSFIDPETNKVVGSVAIGPKPAGATFLDSLSEGFVPPAKLYVAERGKDGEGGAQDYQQDDDDRSNRSGMVRVLLGPATASASTAFSFSPGTAIEAGNAPEGLAANPDGTQLWVPNPNDDSISIISPARDAAVSTVSLAQPDPTGGQHPEDANGPKVRHGPVAVGFSPDGGFAYVAGRDSNSLMVLDVGRAVTDASNAILDTLEVGHAPVALTMDPEGSLIYVVNRGGNDVAVVDVRSPQVPVLHARIPVGKAPEGIALMPDRSKLYVTNSESDAVSVLQVEPGPNFLSLVATIPVGKEPSGIAITKPGSIVNQPFVYVANRGDNTISVISTVSDQVIATIPVGKSPTGVATVLIPTIP